MSSSPQGHSLPGPRYVGRGSSLEPQNRFVSRTRELNLEELERQRTDEEESTSPKLKTRFYEDLSQSIVSENDSPDLSANFTLNPYRGCEHGCAYCYARPSHEYLDLNAGIDFETKIFVKLKAAELFRDWIRKQKQNPGFVAISGVTDCYQPVERNLELTRSCLKVALEARLPIRIVTKNKLVLRDLDILHEMASRSLISVGISLTSLDQSLIRVLEPRTSSPVSPPRSNPPFSRA
ncbi:MAG: hypothetical protein R3C11_05430 [Planctomycetaceae bacterium]